MRTATPLENSTGWNTPCVPEAPPSKPAVSGAAAGTPSRVVTNQPSGPLADNRTVILFILQHALGVDQYGRGEPYRNFFAVEEGPEDHDVCTEAVRQGLMIRRPRGPLMRDMDLFHVTPAGRAYVAAHSPKPNRKRRRAGACHEEKH